MIESPQNQSACEGGTVEFTCVMMFPSGTTPGGVIWATDGGADASQLPDHTTTNDANGRSAPANVTTVLTVTNVNISRNGKDYVCGIFGIGVNAVASNTSFLTVLSKQNFNICYTYVCIPVFKTRILNLKRSRDLSLLQK